MNIKTARQLKDLIRNLSKRTGIDTQILMRNYMLERFLERIANSEYRNKFILKGGMLVASMVGITARSTLDMDATIRGLNVNAEDMKNIVISITNVPVDDGVTFKLDSVTGIMDKAEYPGIRMHLTTSFDNVHTILKLDFSTGDVITPSEVLYSYKLMFEDRTIDVLTYSIETILAEKLESVISRGTSNTRMRDFYDIYILTKLHSDTLSNKVLHDALLATACERESQWRLASAGGVFDKVERNANMQAQWENYRKNYSYAIQLEWYMVMESVRSLYARCKSGGDWE